MLLGVWALKCTSALIKYAYIILHYVIIMQTYLKVLDFWNTYQVHSVEYVSTVQSSLSIIFMQNMGCVYSVYPFLL